MAVKGGNRVGKSLAGKQVTVLVGDGTKFRRSGKAKLADLKAGDLLLVQGRACKLDAVALHCSPSRRSLRPTPRTEATTTSTSEGTSTSTTTPDHYLLPVGRQQGSGGCLAPSATLSPTPWRPRRLFACGRGAVSATLRGCATFRPSHPAHL